MRPTPDGPRNSDRPGASSGAESEAEHLIPKSPSSSGGRSLMNGGRADGRALPRPVPPSSAVRPKPEPPKGATMTASQARLYSSGWQRLFVGLLALLVIAGLVGAVRASVDSTSARAGHCGVDTDGDGVEDHVDLDDDNDGIVDAVECPVSFVEIFGGGDNITVLSGVGDGTFNNPVIQSLTVGDVGVSNAENTYLRDVTGDGIADIVNIHEGLNRIAVYTGVGDGTFNTAIDQPITVPNGGAGNTTDEHGFLDDVSGDGFPDFVEIFGSGDTITVYPGVGDGTFNSAVVQNITVGDVGVSNSENTYLRDVTADGVLDLVNIHEGLDRISVYTGVGDGTFATEQYFSAGRGTSFVTVGDFNGDGFSDLATTGSNYGFANEIFVLLNQRSNDILIGDVNLDGVVNLVDVAPFVDLVLEGEFQAEADTNGDGVVDLSDVQPFVDLLTG